jgi:hypothetical protein
MWFLPDAPEAFPLSRLPRRHPKRRCAMHKNLVRIQEKMVSDVAQNLKIFEISDKRPLILLVLAIAERALAEREIAARTRLGASVVRKGLGNLVKKDFIVAAAPEASRERVYELNPDLEKIAARNIHSKIETLRSNKASQVAEYESLLESAKAEFDDYDRLMARYLRGKINRMKFLTAVMTKRNSLLRLLDSGDGDNAEIRKISIK